jgi:hypothetical protein
VFPLTANASDEVHQHPITGDDATLSRVSRCVYRTSIAVDKKATANVWNLCTDPSAFSVS